MIYFPNSEIGVHQCQIMRKERRVGFAPSRFGFIPGQSTTIHKNPPFIFVIHDPSACASHTLVYENFSHQLVYSPHYLILFVCSDHLVLSFITRSTPFRMPMNSLFFHSSFCHLSLIISLRFSICTALILALSVFSLFPSIHSSRIQHAFV